QPVGLRLPATSGEPVPVHLFTFHAHGSWMPDRPEGYVKRRHGVLPTDPKMANAYRARQNNPSTTFAPEIREAIIDLLRAAAEAQQVQLHAVATDPTHVHALVAWNSARTVIQVRANMKESLTRRLNQRFGRRAWFSRGGHDRRVRNREHFEHLFTKYLPSHVGPNWSRSDR
ncbi:MAG: transposase, partial [Planctomycetota bacterium]